jgi:hypothetical protein
MACGARASRTSLAIYDKDEQIAAESKNDGGTGADDSCHRSTHLAHGRDGKSRRVRVEVRFTGQGLPLELPGVEVLDFRNPATLCDREALRIPWVTMSGRRNGSSSAIGASRPARCPSRGEVDRASMASRPRRGHAVRVTTLAHWRAPATADVLRLAPTRRWPIVAASRYPDGCTTPTATTEDDAMRGSGMDEGRTSEAAARRGRGSAR